VVPGHEFSGEIVEVGREVKGWEKGARVTAEPSAFVCGECYYCRAGSYNLCAERKIMGFWVDGAFAEYVSVPAGSLHRLPESIGYEEGALIEPFACCVHGVLERGEVKLNDVVVVSGPGTIGTLTTMLVKEWGGKVIVVGTDKDISRLALMRELGADYTVNSKEEDPVGVVDEITGGKKADIVFECSGAEQAIDLGIEMLRKQGRYMQLGLFGHAVRFNFEKIVYNEIVMTGTFAQKWTAWKKAIELLADEKVSLTPLITGRLKLEDWEKGFQNMRDKTGIKTIFRL
jgi:L-iditol 2-dehydrogenase